MARARRQHEKLIPRRYQMILYLDDGQKIAFGSDFYASSIDFCNRFSEGNRWELVDFKVQRVIANNKTHGKKGQDGQG